MNVIVADDEKWVRATIVNTIPFERLGLNLICEASNGVEALELCKQHKPDILITDIMMPGLNGLELITQLQKDLPEIRIIIISGYTDFEYAKAALKLGVCDYVLKPVDANEITKVLTNVMDNIKTERMKQEEISTLKTNFNHALTIIHEKYLNAIIQPNTQTVDHIKNQLAKYNIFFNLNYFTLIIFSPEKDSHFVGNSKSAQYKTLIRRIMKHYFQSVSFSVTGNENEIVTIINHESSRPDKLQKALELCTRISLKRFGYVPSIGISLSEQRIKNLPELYSQASEILQMHFWLPEQKIYQYSPNVFSESLNIKISDETLDSLALDIKFSSTYTIFKYIESTITNLSIFGKARPILLKEFFWTFIQGLIGKLNMQLSFIEYVTGLINQSPYDMLKSASSSVQLESDVKLLVSHIYEHYLFKSRTSAENIIETAKKIIDQNYNMDISLEQLARCVHLSPAYFSELFKRETGMSFIDYKTLLRIDAAKSFLSNSNLNIYDICIKVGYTDPKYFSKLFKKVTGKTPHEFKENKSR